MRSMTDEGRRGCQRPSSPRSEEPSSDPLRRATSPTSGRRGARDHGPRPRAARRDPGPRSPMSATRRATAITVIDTDRLEVIKTVKVGQRPRGIDAEQGRHGAVRLRSATTTPSRCIDTKTLEDGRQAAVRPRSRAIARSARRQAASSSPTRTTRCVTVIDVATRKAGRRNPGRRRAGGHGGQPGRQDRRQHLRNDQHGASHRLRDAQGSSPTCSSTRVRAIAAIQAGRLGAVGVVGSRRHGQRDRSGKARRQDKINFDVPGLREGGDPAGRRSASRKDGKLAFVALGPANRVAVDRRRRPRRCRNICWSASASGRWRSRRTTNIF